jgi:hypothetical protein
VQSRLANTNETWEEYLETNLWNPFFTHETCRFNCPQTGFCQTINQFCFYMRWNKEFLVLQPITRRHFDDSNRRHGTVNEETRTGNGTDYMMKEHGKEKRGGSKAPSEGVEEGNGRYSGC